MMRVNLNWDAKPPRVAGFFKKNTQLDLDLGCLYEFTDGTKGVVQALGNAFSRRPTAAGHELIRLDGDDRSGAASDRREPVRRPRRRRADQAHPRLRPDLRGRGELGRREGRRHDVPGAAPRRSRCCSTTRATAPASAPSRCSTSENGEIVVRREVNYLNGAQRALDEAYGWGMNWTAGRK